MYKYILPCIAAGKFATAVENIAGGWTQNVISILCAKYRLVSEELRI